MKQSILLLKDVDGLGRSGDVVSAKPGHIRNYLLPSKFAVIANKHTIKMKERLQADRLQLAQEQRNEAEKISAGVHGVTIRFEVKVDPEGHMYGSVSAQDIADALAEKGFNVEKREVAIGQALKKVGLHHVPLKLKENVTCTVKVRIASEGDSQIEEVVEEQEQQQEEQQQVQE